MTSQTSIKGRYGNVNTFTSVANGLKWKLGTDFYRLGFDNEENNNINFVDPSGGPFIGVGHTYQDIEVKSIMKLEDEDGLPVFLLCND